MEFNESFKLAGLFIFDVEACFYVNYSKINPRNNWNNDGLKDNINQLFSKVIDSLILHKTLFRTDG
jgi:hypothetical protein